MVCIRRYGGHATEYSGFTVIWYIHLMKTESNKPVHSNIFNRVLALKMTSHKAKYVRHP